MFFFKCIAIVLTNENLNQGQKILPTLLQYTAREGEKEAA